MNNLHQRNLPVPFFSQRENKYEWQRISNGNSDDDYSGILTVQKEELVASQGIVKKKHLIGETIGYPVSLAFGSCNITSLCMMLHYFGITGDTPDDMLKKFYEWRPGWLREEYHPEGTDNRGPRRLEYKTNLVDFVKQVYKIYNVRVENLNIPSVKTKIQNGYPVLFSHGAPFEQAKRGHISVIRGFTEHDDIIVNDPWGDITSPFGLLAPRGTAAAAYYNNDKLDYYNCYYGLGTGDNCIIRQDEFTKISTLGDELVITYPHLWSFPIKQTEQTGGSVRKSRFCFSKPKTGAEETASATQEANRIFRSVQIAKMMGCLTTDRAGYPLGTHTRHWHDGIHLQGGDNEPVYAAGPGRLVAARLSPPDEAHRHDSNSFVLVRHNLVLDDEPVEFYSLYMHLAPVSIKERIAEMLVNTNAGTPANREHDWLDQILHYIQPKKAIVRVKGKDADGVVTPAEKDQLMIYRQKDYRTLEPTGEYLPERGIINLYPLDTEIRTFLENIDTPLTAGKKSEIFSLINNKQLYKKKFTVNNNEREYYAFYHGTNSPAGYKQEIGYVRETYLYPQLVNFRAFIHYREKLRALACNEVVVFNGEDTDSSTASVVNKRTAEDVFNEYSRDAFNNRVNFTGSGINARYREISQTYSRLSRETGLPNSLFQNFDQLVDDLASKFFILAKNLMEYQQNEIADHSEDFRIGKPWYNSLKSTYKEILETSYKKSIDTVKNRVDALVRSGGVEFNYADKGKVSIREAGRLVLGKNFSIEFKEVRIQDFYGEITSRMKDEINKITKDDNYHLNVLIFYERIISLFAYSSAELILYPAAYFENGEEDCFKTGEQWYINYMPTACNNIINHLFITSKEVDYLREQLDNRIKTYMPANIDYHIEVGANTKLGCMGALAGKDNILHFEIFSDSLLVDGPNLAEKYEKTAEQKFVYVSEKEKNNVYRSDYIIDGMRQKELFKDERYFPRNANYRDGYINDQALLEYYEGNKVSYPEQFYISTHYNLYTVMTEDELSNLINKGTGTLNSRADSHESLYYKWFSREVYENISPNPSNNLKDFFATFYHPIRFLEWLDKKMTETV